MPAAAPTRRPADLVWRPCRASAATGRADGRRLSVVRRHARDVPRCAGDDRGRRTDRTVTTFGTAHLLFARLDATYEQALDAATETLTVRYAMDFRRAAQRYCALGRPARVAERIREFHAAGVRHVILDLLGPYEQRARQIEWFAAEALPLLRDLTGPASD